MNLNPQYDKHWCKYLKINLNPQGWVQHKDLPSHGH